MARILTLVLLAASVATFAFGTLIEDEDARLSVDFCKDNTNGTCGECPGLPMKYSLNKCGVLESKVAFLGHDYYHASCNKTDNTFTLTRYTDPCEGDGVTVKAPVGCFTRYVVGRFTVSVKGSVSWSGPSISVKPVLKICESDEKSCPEDCAVNVMELSATDGSCTAVDSSGGALSYRLDLDASLSSVSVSFKLWEGVECAGDAIGTIEKKSLSVDAIGTTGICVPLATQHWDVTCGVPIGSSPAFVGGSLQFASCTHSTNGTCEGCSSSPKEIKLSDECAHDPSTVAFSDYNFYSASCNDDDDATTFTLIRYKDQACETRGVRMKAPVGCFARHVVGRLTAQLQRGALGAPTGIESFVFRMCESQASGVCPKDCSINTLPLSTIGDGCTYARGTDGGAYSYQLSAELELSSLSVTVGFGLWKNSECAGDAIERLTPQKISLASIAEDGICVPLSSQHWNVTCLPRPVVTPLGENNSSDSVSRAVVGTGLVATLFAALMLY